ncbi:MAG: lipoyl synthase [Spirochaetales bacterium]|nr:lipoyl synthase [Spirochaetales bacterium]
MRQNRKPEWLRISLKTSEDMVFIDRLLKEKKINTVCTEARCPNRHICWGRNRTATFMVLGDICTRGCGFCSVRTGQPGPPDKNEIDNLITVAGILELEHIVITMVTRDDLDDGGAGYLYDLIRRIRKNSPQSTVEILSSDLRGDRDSIQKLMDAGPDIVGHNLETVRRLTPLIRKTAQYDRSLGFLRQVSSNGSSYVKSALMLGLGEEKDEVLETMDDMLNCNVQILNIGQYLQPSREKLPVKKYWEPDEFSELKDAAMQKGFLYCEAGPLVRSSYMAADNPLLRKRKQ